MLKATDITVSLGGRTILNGIQFTGRAGEVTAIVGPNGCGKTTLMKAMTAEVPYGGTVELDGCDIAKMKGWDLAARRAVLPQSVQVAFPFTVLEILALGLCAGIGSARRDRPREALERVGLAGFEGRPYQALSGGEQQRVQLARVLLQVWEPVVNDVARWLFLDEPVSSLDIGHQLEVMQIAREFADSGGGVITVMHDLNLTAMYSDRVVLIHAGRILSAGSPMAVLNDDTLSKAYQCRLRVNQTPPEGPNRFLLPHVAGARGEFGIDRRNQPATGKVIL